VNVALQYIIVSAAVAAFLSCVLTAVHYPYDTDPPDDPLPGGAERRYYERAYGHDRQQPTGPFSEDDEYVQKARTHAIAAEIPQSIESFVQKYQLHGGRALEVGAGSGLLQDVVHRYVAMDVSPTASRFFHKPFVVASGANIPFGDDSFDIVWSIWVLEHVSHPERTLSEMRRVVRNGGYVVLRPAWDCDPWAADGYEVRPFTDFGLIGKLIKASIPIRLSPWYSLLYRRQVRMIRTLATAFSGRASRLHFVRLNPNYSKYWVTDSDAAVSLDFFETFLWFTSRADDCVNAPSRNALLFGKPGLHSEFLVVRVNKSQSA
jgi:SAM-dependent methyltransferase